MRIFFFSFFFLLASLRAFVPCLLGGILGLVTESVESHGVNAISEYINNHPAPAVEASAVTKEESEEPTAGNGMGGVGHGVLFVGAVVSLKPGFVKICCHACRVVLFLLFLLLSRIGTPI